MRCLIKLRAEQDQAYQSAYHTKLQGFLYRTLENAGYDFIHREKPFKFVSFSNIFPPKDMSEGDVRTWIVASPHEHLVEQFADAISEYDTVAVGDQRYTVKYTSVFDLTPQENGTLQTGTPIVVRIPASRCEEYGIAAEYDDVYWRLEHPLDAFKQELERNLAAKYRRYYDKEPPERPYFTNWTPQKEIAVPLHYEDSVVQTIATTWRLDYECRTRSMYRLVKLAYCAGLGELNTTGFGFMNEL
ncbi:CRISPR-associated endoribonuclease Cas6 [Halocatena marina]|uniref:CRISPR-associated endoribonuclease Cas6 n=1 Tax=Halocatena marina TaxID=2934937 RepID=A0ABD5YXL8_9EURY|nr:CRISPR-associated endoribonuclease Cas6 [Halocatena marina]